ncbi:MAG: sigma-70 family RNA polymerase sigma factor [Gemmataceae bacterium]|nr:sigma-70 family RNA polymerase sigma factor [Gemmataceae bacterium]
MASVMSPAVSRSVPGPPAEAQDADLLARFLEARDAAAFELLMDRHGGMVMGLLRRLGLQEADAEDAFQAAFLTLVRKAASIGKRGSLASWLYKVAYRIGLEQRERVRKRHAKEHPLTGSEPAPMKDDLTEFWLLLDAEVMQLSEKYRVPLLLCQLQGMSLEEAGRRLGCPSATVGTRLARARDHLRARLAKRGLALTGATVATYLNHYQPAQSAPAPAVIRGTLEAAMHLQHGVAVSAISAEALTLSDRALHSMVVAKVKLLALVAAVVMAFAAVAAAVAPALLNPSPGPIAPAKLATPPGDEDEGDWLSLWGKVVDPARDTEFKATRKTLTLTVPGGAHVFGADGRRTAPRVMREVGGDFLIQVKTATVLPKGTPRFERDLLPPAPGADRHRADLNAAGFQGAGIVVMQDDQNLLKLGRGTLFHQDSRENYLAWQSHSPERSTHDSKLVSGRPFAYLRLQRFGPHLFPAGSHDGERWTNLPPITGELPAVLQVGLVAEHNTSEGFQASFSDFKLHRFHFGNNPQPAKKGQPPPRGCARCHGDAVPEPAPAFRFDWLPVANKRLSEKGTDPLPRGGQSPFRIAKPTEQP